MEREYNLLEEGRCSFVIKGVYTNDKDGNPLRSKKSGASMIKVILQVTDDTGRFENIFVYFVDNWLKFLGDLLDAVDLPNNYTPEMVFSTPDYILGLKGECMVGHEEYMEKMQNRVTKYLKKAPVAVVKMPDIDSPPHGMMSGFDSDIPF